MPEHEFSKQMELMNRNLQRMRLAIIVIAAFFVYEAIGPLPFGGDRIKVQEAVKVRELFVVDARGETVAYLGADDGGAGLILDDAVGNRLDARPATVRLMSAHGDGWVERLRIWGEGVEAYDDRGRVTEVFPRR